LYLEDAPDEKNPRWRKDMSTRATEPTADYLKKLALYERLVATNPDVERKGDTAVFRRELRVRPRAQGKTVAGEEAPLSARKAWMFSTA